MLKNCHDSQFYRCVCTRFFKKTLYLYNYNIQWTWYISISALGSVMFCFACRLFIMEHNISTVLNLCPPLCLAPLFSEQQIIIGIQVQLTLEPLPSGCPEVGMFIEPSQYPCETVCHVLFFWKSRRMLRRFCDLPRVEVLHERSLILLWSGLNHSFL